MYRFSFLLLICLGYLSAEGVKSTNGRIDFDVENDGVSEMKLNSVGLGINTTATHSTLEVNGSLSFGIESVSSNTDLSGNTLVLADTSMDNLILTLPTANSCIGRIYQIKKTSLENQLWIESSESIDGFSAAIEMTHQGAYLSKCSLLSDGSQWLLLDRTSDVFSVVAADNLMGWWKLDGLNGTEAKDSSQYSRTGTLTGFTLSANGLSGVHQRGLYFDGSNDLIEVDDDDALDPSEITLTGWLRVSNIDTTGNFFNKGDNSGYRFRVSGGYQLQFLDRGNTNNLTGTTVLPKHTWVHAAVTGNASGLTIYYNGALDNSNATAYGGPNTADVLEFGRYATGERYRGALDDLRVYNKSLSAAEIKAIYQQGL
jgi:hypothetical protein